MITKDSKCSEKLNHLADWLDANVPAERFNFAWWGRNGNSHDAPPSCGTTACAGGWADEAFKGCEGYEPAWYRVNFDWTFSRNALERWLGLDNKAKTRPGETFAYSDFARLFMDMDDKLAGQYGSTWEIPMHAVTARIRACAKAYARRGK
jgi:hypothetical protein